jgi:alpha-glucosidase
MSKSVEPNWLSKATIYHIYVRSFADSDGDGHGDINGIVEHMPYIESLGVDAIWLSPVTPSPNHDWGYDVTDYYAVADEYGGMDALELLIKRAAKASLKTILDLVPNHTSTEHPWFQAARADRNSEYRDYYVWANPSRSGQPPNNWLDATGESAWTFDPDSHQYYLHNFLPTQPDLNWWNPLVREEFQKILRYWFDLGVDGFRIDVAHGIYKDKLLRNDPPATAVVSSYFEHFGLDEVYSKNRPEVHSLYRSWRKLADEYQPPKLLIGETWVSDLDRLIRFYGRNDELHLAMNFPFTFSQFNATAIASLVMDTMECLPSNAYICWAASNHDISRFPTRWCQDDETRIRTALILLTTLPGTLILYYGDELGIGDSVIKDQFLRDEITANTAEKFKRDYSRGPMPWSNDDRYGFTKGSPWLPFGKVSTSVAAQSTDEHSILNLTRKLLTIRKEELTPVGLKTIVLAYDYWCYQVGNLEIHINFGASNIQVVPSDGVLIDHLGLERQVSADGETLGPFGAFIIRRT